MKYLKSYKIFENISQHEISISDFLEKIGIQGQNVNTIVDWWQKNRQDIKLHYFRFSSPQPIAGVFLGEDTVCINSKNPMPPHVKLFLALHESAHCNQHREGRFMSGYWETVINNDKESFLKSYRELEKDANDFAINAMRECGFTREMNSEEMRLRSNEGAGHMVYNMMKSDIDRLKPVDFFDLLKKQVL